MEHTITRYHVFQNGDNAPWLVYASSAESARRAVGMALNWDGTTPGETLDLLLVEETD